MESPPFAGDVQADPIVTINGIPIDIFPISESGNIMTMAGNISAYAGTTVALTFLCQATAGSFPADENIFALDDIQFSAQSVPEPSVLGFFGMGVALLVGCITKIPGWLVPGGSAPRQ